jgi:hypothetical protein
VCVIADGRGGAIGFALAPGQGRELPMAQDLRGRLPGVPGRITGDRGLALDDLRGRIWEIGARPASPPRRGDTPAACPEWIDNNRHLGETLWACLKEWRALATRYEKTRRSFLAVLCLAATQGWFK